MCQKVAKSLKNRGKWPFLRKKCIFFKKSVKKFGGKEKSRTFATRLRKNGSSLTSLRKDNEVKLEDEIKDSL